MKRKLLTIVASLLIATMVLGMLAACGSSSIGGKDTETPSVAAGGVNFTFKVTAKEGGNDYTLEEAASSDAETFGEYLRTVSDCQWEESEYGIFVQGFGGIVNVDSDELWWQLFVDGESAQVGADMIELTEGAVYEYVYTKGYDW